MLICRDTSTVIVAWMMLAWLVMLETFSRTFNLSSGLRLSMRKWDQNTSGVTSIMPSILSR